METVDTNTTSTDAFRIHQEEKNSVHAAQPSATHGRSLQQLPVESLWFATLDMMPCLSGLADPTLRCFVRANPNYFTSEKDAISAARKLRVAEVERLTAEINALDERYDAIEDLEMKNADKTSVG